MSDRRPYRVVFRRARDSGRTGTIVVRREDTAHDEARRIAATGGTAHVQYVHRDGRRETLASYTDDQTPQ
ncbi:MAG: hypothetical protein L0I76_24600 [Pseudonocardia sp.]|nr:hypothetical protein [Pseudonocardia sp.]